MNAAQIEAIANADAHANNVGLPTYSELVEALRKLPAALEAIDAALPVEDLTKEQRAAIRAFRAPARALLARIPA